ncbi:MAG: PAS domain S-box protein [Deltaproteobacteria bacterium]|nr:PAS domain S-box protein [Deltaproteobacteria bacterium]
MRFKLAQAAERESTAPLLVLLIVTFSIAAAEALIMLVISFLPPSPRYAITLLDAFLLTLLVFPMLYLILFQPMVSRIAECRRAEDASRRARRFAEECNAELVEKTAYMDGILGSSASAAIAATDLDLRIKYFNPAAERFFGLKPDEAIGRRASDITFKHGDYPLRFEAAGEAVRLMGEYRYSIEAGTAAGLKYLDARITGIWKRGGLIGFVLVCQDITERRLAEDKLKELNSHLEKRVAAEALKQRKQEQLLMQQSRLAAMGEMMDAIAHQWREPLSSLCILIQDLEDRYASGRLDARYIDKTVKMAFCLVQFMSETVDDFRSFLVPSREKSPFDVKIAIKEVLALMSTQLKHHNIFIRFRCGIKNCATHGARRTLYGDILKSRACEDCGRVVMGYPNEFKQIVLNLLDNAKDAIMSKREQGRLRDGKGRIEIEVYGAGKTMVTKIRDNGGGIPEDIIERVFDPHFTTKDDGTGIGLYMSKVVIENGIGGRLYAGNSEEGAVFTIELERA